MSLPIEVPWILAATDAVCLQCDILGDIPNQKLTRIAEENSKRKGWIIVRYECPECHWKPQPVTTCMDAAEAVQPQRAVAIPTTDEVKKFSATPPKITSKSITLPPEKPVELGELKEHIEKTFGLVIDLEQGRAMKREVIAGERKNDAEGQEAVGWVTVVYEYGKSVDGGYNPYRVEKNYPCTGELPSWEDEEYEILRKLKSQLKVANASGITVNRNKAPTKFRGACSQCGDTSGQCGHAGLLTGTPGFGVPMAVNTGVTNDGVVLLNRNGERIPDMRDLIAQDV